MNIVNKIEKKYGKDYSHINESYEGEQTIIKFFNDENDNLTVVIDGEDVFVNGELVDEKELSTFNKKEYNKRYYQEHKEQLKKYQKDHPEKRKAALQKLKEKDYWKVYYQEHLGEMRARHRIYNRYYQQMFAYCKEEEINKIENYEEAKKDDFKGWVIHHRLELDGITPLTADELKGLELYFNRPASELIFMKVGDHTKLHNTAKK